MKKVVILLIAVAVTAQLCGCTGSIGEVVEKMKNDVPEKQEQAEELVMPEGEPEELSAEEETPEITEEAPETPEEPELTEEEETVQTYLDQREVWENGEALDFVSNGVYGTGYAFFDINLDGVKELAVQYGGGSMHNCTTGFYRLSEDGNVIPYTAPDSLFSLSVLDLSLAEGNGERFYLMEYAIKSGPAEYWKYLERIDYDGEASEFSGRALFSELVTYDEAGAEHSTFFVGNDEVSAEQYAAEYESYRSGYTVTKPGTVFIPYTDWKEAGEESQYEMLLDSLKA